MPPTRKWSFWNLPSNFACNTGLFFDFDSVYLSLLCFLTLVKRLHYMRNLTENFKKFTFWGMIFLKFPWNCAYNTVIFFDFFALYYSLNLLLLFFDSLENASIVGANWPKISKTSLYGWKFWIFLSNGVYNTGLFFDFFCPVLVLLLF